MCVSARVTGIKGGPVKGEVCPEGNLCSEGSCRAESVVAAPQEEPAAVGRKGLTGTFLRVGDTSSSGDAGGGPPV